MMLILSGPDVRQALSMRDAIAAMRKAFAAFGRGDVVQPNRSHIDISRHSGGTLVMPAYAFDEESETLAVKVVSVFPKNSERGEPRIQAAVLVADPTCGKPVALIDGTAITAIRTAAVSGLATDLLARDDSDTLAIIGTGVQAATHLEAIRSVRPIKRVFVAGRGLHQAEEFVNRASNSDGSLEFIPVESADRAVEAADIVCTVTTAQTPLFRDESIADGTHINAVGSYQPHVCEIAHDTVVRSHIFVDQIQAALEEAGDLIQPMQTGAIDPNQFVELAQVLDDPSLGRASDSEITLFKSVGLAVEDAFAAAACLKSAKTLGLGVQVPW